jgi:hypothetical protein
LSENFTQDFRTQRRNYNDGTTRVDRQVGRLWYASEDQTIRVSDGATPGGIILVGGGGGPGGSIIAGDNVSLLTNDAGYTVAGDNVSLFTNDAGYVVVGANISSFTNDANYISLTSLSATGDLTYNNSTGQFSVTTYKSADFDTDLASKTTDDLVEGSVNLYFTDGRVDARIADASISSLIDVDNDLVINLQEDSILIYNAAGNEFVAESFLEVLDRLKAELEVQYDRLVDEDGTATYIGEAAPGTARNIALWRIKKVTENGDDLDILWADGSASFDKIWDNRINYAYN